MTSQTDIYFDDVVKVEESQIEHFEIDVSKSLTSQIASFEAKVKSMPVTEQTAMASKYYTATITFARKAASYGVYFGIILRHLFEGKNQKEQEAICKTITGRSLSSGRRYIRLVENISLVEQEVQENGLEFEEVALTKLLTYVPKQEGKGGRPKKADKPPQRVTAAVPRKSTTALTVFAPTEEAPTEEAPTEEAPTVSRTDDVGEVEITLSITGKVTAAKLTISDVVASLENGDAELVAEPFKIMRGNKEIGRFQIAETLQKN